jgi:ActR/RegA family two-component response regulator
VLVVDNEETTRAEQIELLLHWGFIPVVAQGIGEALRADAIRKAHAHRCQIALVDMRLDDNYDRDDWSGLKLVPQLQPTAAIILSGFGDRKTAVAALKEYGAFDFVGREDGPEQLQATIEAAAHALSACLHRPQITWSEDLTSAKIRDMLFARQKELHEVPDEEADEVIGRLFRTHQRVTLTLIADATEPSNRVSALRRSSRVFRAIVDDQAALRVVKLARTAKIEHESHNYKAHVQYGMQSQFRPEMFAEVLLWDMGAIAYSYMGNPGLGIPGGPQTFTAYYRATEHADQILPPLRHFFDDANWGIWYKKEITALGRSLFAAYDEVWHGTLSDMFEKWREHDQQRSFVGLPVALPNPTRWLVQNVHLCNQVLYPRQAVTHGDLHGDNLFVNKDHAWPIDFERTGPGPILRDFVELIQDVLTRLARFEDRDLPIFYELAVALCGPSTPAEPMRPTAAIQNHPEALKAFQVVQELQNLAHERARYNDRREYLWGLLLNNLFVVTLLTEEDPRRARTLLLAGVICARLSRWNRPDWPPRDWPPVSYMAQTKASAAGSGKTRASTAPRSRGRAAQPKAARSPLSGGSRFTHGYALLVGVGADLPVTVQDATALHELLVDPQRCAYPPEQVLLLTEAQATRQAMLASLDQLSAYAQADADATVVVYFSGHGIRTPGSYLVPYGFDLSNLSDSALSGAEFTAKLRAIPSRKLLVLLDCCHSGGLAEAKAGLRKEAIPPELNAALTPGSGRVVIASSRRDEYSYTGTPYSVFTGALREALAGQGAAEPDGFAYMADVALYVAQVVPERTAGKQHPVLKLASADSFAIAYYAAGAKTPLPLPAAPAAGLRRESISDVARVRSRLKELTDDEFGEFCQDHFPEVAAVLTPGQTLTAKVRYLIDHCQRKPAQWAQLNALLLGS